MKIIQIPSLRELGHAAKQFADLTQGHQKFAFYGALGAGKTTFIKAICRELGASDPVTSPTFALVNEYRTAAGLSLYHFDLYRINTLEELFDLGYEEYFYGDSPVFVEWADKAEDLIPDFFVRVYLVEKDMTSREVRIHFERK